MLITMHIHLHIYCSLFDHSTIEKYGAGKQRIVKFDRNVVENCELSITTSTE